MTPTPHYAVYRDGTIPLAFGCNASMATFLVRFALRQYPHSSFVIVPMDGLPAEEKR